MSEGMSCEPGELQIPRYLLIGRLGHAEREEAAARLVAFCQDQGGWQPVSWAELVREQIAPEAAAILRDRDRQRASWEEQDYRERMAGYRRRAWLTAGLYRLYVKPPEASALPEPALPDVTPADYQFQSFLHLGLDRGLSMITAGLDELEQLELIRHVVVDGNPNNKEGDNHQFVVLPALVERLLATA